ncbi:MAG: hypothetical protein LUI13_11455 [Lachnospiraceae bacterium]|nr:hypothetical protein [Lachnospiraceae bacterium]
MKTIYNKIRCILYPYLLKLTVLLLTLLALGVPSMAIALETSALDMVDASTESAAGESSGLTAAEAEYCLDTPVLEPAYARSSGVRISWNAVGGADGYAVLRKTSGGDWELLGTTDSLRYTDKSEFADGITRVYTVRAWRGDEDTALASLWDPAIWSACDENGVISCGLGTPELAEPAAEADGTFISWNAVSDASGYLVYRKTAEGKWQMIAITEAPSYTDQSNLSNGEIYYYTVRAFAGTAAEACANQYDAACWSGYDSEGVLAIYLAAPELETAYAAAAGTRISWSAVDGAAGYAIYRKMEGEESWILLDTTSEHVYTDSSELENGTVCWYTVRAFRASASRAGEHQYSATYWSGYDENGVKAISIQTPVLQSLEADDTSITISWSRVAQAECYAVYRRAAGGDWTLIGKTQWLRYTDRASLPMGTSYYYTVRACTDANASTGRYSALFWSGFDPSGLEYSYGYSTNALTLAAAFIEANTTSDMTNRQKLDTCFSALLRFSYTRTYDTADASNLSSFAEQLFANKTGNCYRYAAGFACIAAVLGYDVRVNVGQITARSGGLTPHGWTEVCVDGVWYLCDPDMQAFNANYSGQYYMTSASAIGLTYAINATYTLTIENGTAVWSR